MLLLGFTQTNNRNNAGHKMEKETDRERLPMFGNVWQVFPLQKYITIKLSISLLFVQYTHCFTTHNHNHHHGKLLERKFIWNSIH